MLRVGWLEQGRWMMKGREGRVCLGGISFELSFGDCIWIGFVFVQHGQLEQVDPKLVHVIEVGFRTLPIYPFYARLLNLQLHSRLNTHYELLFMVPMMFSRLFSRVKLADVSMVFRGPSLSEDEECEEGSAPGTHDSDLTVQVFKETLWSRMIQKL